MNELYPIMCLFLDLAELLFYFWKRIKFCDLLIDSEAMCVIEARFKDIM